MWTTSAVQKGGGGDILFIYFCCLCHSKNFDSKNENTVGAINMCVSNFLSEDGKHIELSIEFWFMLAIYLMRNAHRH